MVEYYLKIDKHIPSTTTNFITLGNTCYMFRSLLTVLRRLIKFVGLRSTLTNF